MSSGRPTKSLPPRGHPAPTHWPHGKTGLIEFPQACFRNGHVSLLELGIQYGLSDPYRQDPGYLGAGHRISIKSRVAGGLGTARTLGKLGEGLASRCIVTATVMFFLQLIIEVGLGDDFRTDP